jgi:hypothetical protein
MSVLRLRSGREPSVFPCGRALRPPSTGTGRAGVGRRGARGVPTASHPNEPRRDAGDVRAQALLDRPPPHWLAEESLDGAVHIASLHRLSPLRKDSEDRLQHPVVPAVPGPDRRKRLLGGAVIGAIFGARRLDAAVQAPFQQGLRGWRGVCPVRSISRSACTRAGFDGGESLCITGESLCIAGDRR